MPADLVPGQYNFQVRATDKQDLTTSSSLQGRVTINVVVPGDVAPNGLLNVTGNQSSTVRHLDLAGTATDDLGVGAVRVSILENDTDRYLRAERHAGRRLRHHQREPRLAGRRPAPPGRCRSTCPATATTR